MHVLRRCFFLSLSVGLLVSGSPCAGATSTELLARIAASDNPDEVVQQQLLGASTPLQFGGEFLFLARARAFGAPPRIVGDFNDGGYAESEVFGDGTMSRIGDTAWYALRAQVGRDARFEYQVAGRKSRTLDPLNPASAITFGTERSLAIGPAVRSRPTITTTAPRGRIEVLKFSSSVRGNERPVHVYIPPVAVGPDPLPTLYVKDGDLFRQEGDLPAMIDTLIARGTLPHVFVVFTEPVNRALEYGGSSDYRQLVIEELIPFIEARFETGGTASRRGLLGASRAGLAVVDLALRHPDVFGFAAALSPAIRPIRFIEQITGATSADARFFVLLSRFDTPAVLADGRGLVDALKQNGHQVSVIEAPIDHTIHAWLPWVDRALLQWYSPAAGSN
ncbi:MAG: alpha/beta hydrolase-fold protein [Pseudomonadota bacterium]